MADQTIELPGMNYIIDDSNLDAYRAKLLNLRPGDASAINLRFDELKKSSDLKNKIKSLEHASSDVPFSERVVNALVNASPQDIVSYYNKKGVPSEIVNNEAVVGGKPYEGESLLGLATNPIETIKNPKRILPALKESFVDLAELQAGEGPTALAGTAGAVAGLLAGPGALVASPVLSSLAGLTVRKGQQKLGEALGRRQPTEGLMTKDMKVDAAFDALLSAYPVLKGTAKLAGRGGANLAKSAMSKEAKDWLKEYSLKAYAGASPAYKAIKEGIPESLDDVMKSLKTLLSNENVPAKFSNLVKFIKGKQKSIGESMDIAQGMTEVIKAKDNLKALIKSGADPSAIKEATDTLNVLADEANASGKFIGGADIIDVISSKIPKTVEEQKLPIDEWIIEGLSPEVGSKTIIPEKNPSMGKKIKKAVDAIKEWTIPARIKSTGENLYSPRTVQNLKSAYANEAKQVFQSPTPTSAGGVSAWNISNALRELINTKYPELKNLNELYHNYDVLATGVPGFEKRLMPMADWAPSRWIPTGRRKVFGDIYKSLSGNVHELFPKEEMEKMARRLIEAKLFVAPVKDIVRQK